MGIGFEVGFIAHLEPIGLCYSSNKQLKDFDAQFKYYDQAPHIYMIHRTNKYKFIPEESKCENEILKLTLHSIAEDKKLLFQLRLPKDEVGALFNSLKFDSGDKRAIVESERGDVFGINACQLITDFSLRDMSVNPGSLTNIDFEILYIGMSFGTEGDRIATERLINHSSLQTILSDAFDENWNNDIVISLWEVNANIPMVLASSQAEESEVIGRMNNFFEGGEPRMETIVNMAEAGLIHYFQPLYNIKLKKQFPDSKTRTYNEVFNRDVDAISIEFCLDNYDISLVTAERTVNMKDCFIQTTVLQKDYENSLFKLL